MTSSVELHTVDLAAQRPLTKLESLPLDEQARAKRFVTQESRDRFITMRHTLRLLLSQKLERDISGVSFHYNDHGKPYLPRCPWHFNFSHAESSGLIALTRDGAIGVDLEAIHPLPELHDLAKRHFSISEQATLVDLSGSAETRRFYQIWTRKEALVKGLGLSFARVSHQLNVWNNAKSFNPQIPRALRHSNEDTWFIQDITRLDGFSAALASTTRPQAIEWHDVA